VRAWREPDYASVNLSEPGALELMEALAGIGVGIEAGVWTVEDAKRVADSGLGRRVTRILVEPGELQLRDSRDKATGALGLVGDIHRALEELGLGLPRLQHGDGRFTWVPLRDAVRRVLDNLPLQGAHAPVDLDLGEECGEVVSEVGLSEPLKIPLAAEAGPLGQDSEGDDLRIGDERWTTNSGSIREVVGCLPPILD
jgi:hypothetical protein